MRYNRVGVKAVEKVEATIGSFGLPLEIASKFNAIISAMEMQIEDYDYTEQMVKTLDKALLLLADRYASETEYADLERAVAEFERTLAKKQ